MRLMLILQFILGLKSKSIDFKDVFDQADIPSEEPVFVELPRDLKSDKIQYNAVLRLKKRLYGQAKAARIWYKKL